MRCDREETRSEAGERELPCRPRTPAESNQWEQNLIIASQLGYQKFANFQELIAVVEKALDHYFKTNIDRSK